jgi:hypothetical protein
MGLVGGVSYYFNSGERKACPTKNCGEGYYAEWTSYEDKLRGQVYLSFRALPEVNPLSSDVRGDMKKLIALVAAIAIFMVLSAYVPVTGRTLVAFPLLGAWSAISIKLAAAVASFVAIIR